MCDTLAIVARRGGKTEVFVAKNSDRDANEAQLLEWCPAAEHPAGTTLRSTWIEIPQARRTHAVLLSRPFWMWGAEMGANEHGLWIGNEAVFTHEPRAHAGLTGMDLVRLALERAVDRHEAVERITAWLADPGQGGGCGYENPGFTYHNSFILADPGGAVLLETAGREWAVEEIEGARTISNGLTIKGFAARHGRRLETAVAAAETRRCRTQELADGLAAELEAQLEAQLKTQRRSHRGVLQGLMAVLRDHGPAALHPSAPRFRWLNGSLGAPCMHGGGLVASSVTTASWVGRLAAPSTSEHWATATSSPCLSLFKPVQVADPVPTNVLGPPPDGRAADASLWWRHEKVHRRILADPVRLGAGLRTARDALESLWTRRRPEPGTAFAEHRALLDETIAELDARQGGGRGDLRPWWSRRYWARRDRDAGIPAGS